ncbi:MAG: nucleotidyltransferase domain-containing protein [Thermomicrobiales bacterium]|nr:nucleotidyltransferase domain-containing protein [Thermomicrobiales bacterium]MCO5218628.1 nucleotidyltransferase domain-containing protein [Thermomicrobiales bacterium]MCO5224305.1 nucleotidyltransferase domain-containing protein [Thermomicrobiales bacterium]MCO5229380.1 nucleotidyltransferase domain-containing protein [Thermomicrobiales bacterium]
MIEQMVQRFRVEHPDAVAVLLKGSHARGEATPWSDMDFDVLVSAPETEIYRTWLVEVDARLVHISAAVEGIDGWLADADEPSSWSLGLPTAETTRLLWAATDELWQRLDHPAKMHPAASAEVEDSVEAFGKMVSALGKGDAPGLYSNAYKLATLIPTLLVPINDVPPVESPRQAIDAVLAMTNVPAGFREDWLICMGYVDCRDLETTCAAAQRMLLGALALIPPDAEIVGEDIARVMVDGSLERYIHQLREM